MAASVRATADRSAFSYPSTYPSLPIQSSPYPTLPPMPQQPPQPYYNSYPSPTLAPVHKFSHVEHDSQSHIPALVPQPTDPDTYPLSAQLPPPDSVYPSLNPSRDPLPQTTVFYDPTHTLDHQQQRQQHQPVQIVSSENYPQLHPPPQINHHDTPRQLDHHYRPQLLNDQIALQSISSTPRSLNPSQSVIPSLPSAMLPSPHIKEIAPSSQRILYSSSPDTSLFNFNPNPAPVTMLTPSVPTYQQVDQTHSQHVMAPAHLPPPSHFSAVLPASVPSHIPQPLIPVSHLRHVPTQSQYDPSSLSTHQLAGHVAMAQDTLATPQSYVTVPQQPTTLLVGHVQQPVNHPALAQQNLVPAPEMVIPQSMVQQQSQSSAIISTQEVMNTCPTASVTPEAVESYLAVVRACRDLGRYDLATEAYRAYTALCPNDYNVNIYANEYNCNLDCGPVYSDEIFNDIGNTLVGVGRTNEAEMAYRAALNVSPCHARAWSNLGNLLRAKGAVVEAMACYSTALSNQPGYALAHSKLAGLLRDQGKPQEAEHQYRAALNSDPNMAEAAAGLGTALRDMGRTEEAVAVYVRAVNLQPNCADHHANLANTYKDLNRIEESIVSYQAALALQPDLPDAFCNMVHSLSVICDWKNRSQNFVTLLAIIDRQLEALLHHSNMNPRLYSILAAALSPSASQSLLGRAISASTIREDSTDFLFRNRRFTHHPSSPTVVRKARMKGKTTNFATSNPSVVAPVLASGLPSVQPFHALIYPMSPEKFRALSAAYAARAESMVAGIPLVKQRWTLPRGPRPRLKVGYVSSDYNNHPYSHLTQSIYGFHRSGKTVECYCYALTPSDNSAWRLRIEREAEHFRDISGMNAKQSAEAIAADGIHVLINCNGYTKGARTELFALRPAPVQVSFMGFPGTLGAHYIEYFITDVVTSPPSLASRMHSEALLYHPHSYFVNDHRQTSIPGPSAYPTGPLTRARYGLPEDCFLFIMHNQLYKLSPETFDVWARILKRVPGSKIWLLRFPATGEQRIRDEAAARGLSADRLIFTDVAGKEEHVARAGLGDLFLDTPTCNAHTTGTDVLWSGVPMITCPGSLFASRVAASLLTAAGLPELIASDMNEYEDLAVELATNRPRLAAIRAKIESTRYTNALFDTERWVRNVEDLYWRAWKNFVTNDKPTNIFGQDVYEESAMVQKHAAVESMYSGSDSHRSETIMYGKVFSSVVAT